MHISHLDLNLLRLFDEIYSGGGVSRAADVLNITQPAVSHGLSRLREQLGDPLFVRFGRGLTPTATAHRLIGPVRRALSEIEVAIKDVKSFDPAQADMRFRIGFNALMEEALFPPVAAAVIEQAPGIRLESVRYDRAEMKQALASFRLDAVIDIDMPVSDTLRSAPIWSGNIVGIARANHPAFDNEGEISLQKYMAMRHVVVSTRPRGSAIEDMTLSRLTMQRRKIAARCQLISSALSLVRQSDLVVSMAAALIDEANIGPDLRVFAVQAALSPVIVRLYWHNHNDADRAHIWLRQQISDCWVQN
jgi:DNA-binding transcriptional LysR family regulator